MEELIGALKRAHITQRVVKEGHWSGSARGLRIRLDLLPLGGMRRVAWHAKAAGWERKGVAGTVYDAIDEIALLWTKRQAIRSNPPTQRPLF